MRTKSQFKTNVLERRIADAFVQLHLNNVDRANYEFVCRPDEEPGKVGKLPDFKYRDKDGDSVTLIEMKRITRIKTTRHMTIYREFQNICEELERKIGGVFWLGVNHEEIRKAKTQKWSAYFAHMKSIIERKALTMAVGDQEPIDGVLLLKIDDQNASFSLFSTNLSPPNTQRIAWFLEVLEKVGMKFMNYGTADSRNILLLLHMESDVFKYEISGPIRLLRAGIYGKEHTSLPLFSGLYSVYVMFIEPFWDKEITLCQCYPHVVCVGLCRSSQIFKDADEMHYYLKRYFLG